MEVSIIIPVYNAEGYLRRCLDSVLSQTLMDFEVICVNDGSTDGSFEILSEYSEKDKRIHIINQRNAGVSQARQVGLEACRGKYVIHADPDDWVEPNWLECLYNEAEKKKVDMVICDFERVFKNKTVSYCQKPTSLATTDVLHDLLSAKLWGPCWNKLVRRDCFEKFHVRFNPKMTIWEDLYVNSLLLLNGVSVSYIPQILYHYDSYTNTNSIVQHRNASHVYSGMILIDDLQKRISDSCFDDCWYYLKSTIKWWIFSVHLSGSSACDIIQTYSEINERYILEASRKPLWSKERCIALCLQGHPRIGFSVFKLGIGLLKLNKSLFK